MACSRRAPRSSDEPGLNGQGPRISLRSRDRLQIRPDDCIDTAELRGAKKLGRRELAVGKPGTERLQRDLGPDTAAKLEAVGDALRGRVDSDRYAVALVGLYPRREH